jgi:hypothetical protein
LTPILRAEFPGAGEQTVAWSVERTDGGRGFGFTGGHYFANWRVPAYRRTLLNAIAWSAKLDVPPGGVDSTIQSGDVSAGDPAWTPRPTAGSNQPWEMANEQDWVDGRLRVMDTGPAFNATYTYPSQRGNVWDYKGMAIKVGDGGVLFDRARLRLAAGWTGGWVKHSDKRFGFLNTPTPVGQMIFTTGDSAGWASTAGGWTPSVTAARLGEISRPLSARVARRPELHRRRRRRARYDRQRTWRRRPNDRSHASNRADQRADDSTGLSVHAGQPQDRRRGRRAARGRPESEYLDRGVSCRSRRSRPQARR